MPFETVVESFLEGSTFEEIAARYPSLDLAEVYAVIAYYLRHRQEIDEYLARSSRQAEEVRAENGRRFPAEGVRGRCHSVEDHS